MRDEIFALKAIYKDGIVPVDGCIISRKLMLRLMDKDLVVENMYANGYFYEITHKGKEFLKQKT